MSAHANRSPSGSAGWLECAGWASDSKGSSYADEGTDAHELASICLTEGTDAAAYAGREMSLGHEVDTEMVGAVQSYLYYVRGVVAATNGTLLVEQRLPIDSITGEEGASGTSDAVILAGSELIVVDLKYGRGVPVAAEDNTQLQIYALAALREFSLLGDFDTVRMVIHQPRINAVSEWTQTAQELESFAAFVSMRIAVHDANPQARNPGEKQCRWCSNKATCVALAADVVLTVTGKATASMDDFDNVEPAALGAETPGDFLATAMSKADLIEAWLKAVRAETESRLLAGIPVQGFKLVQGKRGARAWSSEDEAEQTLKAMRIPHDQMYDYSVISPTSAEKLAKAGAIGPRQWPKLQGLITQPDGRPSVAPESDKRPALNLSAAADDFDAAPQAQPACDLS